MEQDGGSAQHAAAQRTERQRQLDANRQNIQQRIRDKLEDAKALQQEMKAVDVSADKAVEESQKIFHDLFRVMEKSRCDVMQQIRSHQEAQVGRVKELLEKLEQEVTELRRRDADLKLLSFTKDHRQFLQSFLATAQAAPPAPSPCVRLRAHGYFQGVTAALAGTKEQLEDILREKSSNIARMGAEAEPPPPEPEPEPGTRAEFLRYWRELTLDQNTANGRLLLSEGNRKATLVRTEQTYSSHPERFCDWHQALSRESLTGRCYWEVEWTGGGVSVAVAYRNVSRRVSDCIFGYNDRSWALHCDKQSYIFWYHRVPADVVGPRSRRIGVYVDHRGGVLAFFSVADTMTLLRRVKTTFTQPLHAGIWLYPTGATVEFLRLK